MFRFYYDQKITDSFQITDKEIINQIARVLRLKPGEHFILFDNSGFEFELEILTIDKNSVEVLLIDKIKCLKESDKNITLYLALLKKDNFELVVQKATEIGAKKIVPIITQNCVVKDFSGNKCERCLAIIKEATEQCGGCKLTELGSLTDYVKAITSLNSKDSNLIAHEKVKADPSAVLKETAETKNINIFIGPEGGFTELEIEMAIKAGIKPISLGKRVLRAETAAISALSCLAIV